MPLAVQSKKGQHRLVNSAICSLSLVLRPLPVWPTCEAPTVGNLISDALAASDEWRIVFYAAALAHAEASMAAAFLSTMVLDIER